MNIDIETSSILSKTYGTTIPHDCIYCQKQRYGNQDDMGCTGRGRGCDILTFIKYREVLKEFRSNTTYKSDLKSYISKFRLLGIDEKMQGAWVIFEDTVGSAWVNPYLKAFGSRFYTEINVRGDFLVCTMNKKVKNRLDDVEVYSIEGGPANLTWGLTGTSFNITDYAIRSEANAQFIVLNAVEFVRGTKLKVIINKFGKRAAIVTTEKPRLELYNDTLLAHMTKSGGMVKFDLNLNILKIINHAVVFNI